MIKKLLCLLVLLLTATTGAWAQDPNSIVINGTPQVGDKSISLTYNFDPANVTGYNYSYYPTLKVKCEDDDNNWDEVNLSNGPSSGTKTITLTKLGGLQAGKTYKVCFAYNNGGWVDDVFQTFVPAASGYTVSMKSGTQDADKWTVKVGEGEAQALPIGGLKGDGSETVTLQYNGRLKVKGVKATSDAAKASLIVNPVVGQVIGDDGKNYADATAATSAGATAVAVIAYVGSETGDNTYKNGLAIALADEGSLKWSTAKSTCEGKTAITGANWYLPSQDQWKQMFKANGNNEGSYNGLNTTITTAGGTTLQEDAYYWSSSELSPGVYAYYVYLYYGNAYWSNGDEDFDVQVRACLAF